MRAGLVLPVLVGFAVGLVSLVGNADSGGIESCQVTDPGTATQVPIAATPYRSGVFGQHLRFREVEFLWDAGYTSTITPQVGQTLDNFAANLAELFGTSPVVTDAWNTEALYLYLNRSSRGWSADPGVFNSSMLLGNSTYGQFDYSHADAYLTNPTTWGTGGQYPSNVSHPDEDLSSGHVTGDILPDNAFRISGPFPPSFHDLTGTGWTAPGSRTFVGFNHELQHSMLPPFLAFNNAFTEMLSAAAEAVTGIGNSDVFSEVPYTWSLLAWSSSQTQPPYPITDPNFHNRFSLNNYQARTSFMSYLAYNFLNANAARTKAGMVDDLLYRWIHGPRLDLVGISTQLNDATCSDCLAKSYFRPGGVPLSDHDRLQLLHHNWRVANLVNNPALAEGQFGFPASGGFSPVQSQRAWQNIDGFTQDDIVALPAIVTLDASSITREVTFQRQRTFREKTHPMTLVPFSANYWVIRPSVSVATQDRDLVVRISPRSFFKAGTFLSLGGNDLRLLASVVAYNQADVLGDETNLYNLPAAAVYSTPVKWVDCDSLASDIELVVPSFGVTHKAAVIVISLGDGPRSKFSELDLIGYREDLPYRLDVSLRTTPSLSQQPSVVSAASTQPDDWPTWAPSSDELAYSAVDFGVAVLFQIYRRRLDGSPAVRVAPQVMNQFSPDWSPRGDLIVFESRPAADQSDLYLAGAVQQTLTQLTIMSGCELLPSFQPNGRGVAYYYTAGPGQPWSLRWIGVNGSGDREVAANVTPSGTPPRWSADGQSIIIYDSALKRLMRHSIAGGAPQQDPSGVLDLESFDVHPGISRLALSSSSPLPNTSFDYPEFNLPGPITSRRVALLDTSLAARDTSYRFVERGHQSRNVRWSPDGCAIAYARSIDGTADRDVYAGRVTWNRAPAFTSLMNDKGIPVGSHHLSPRVSQNLSPLPSLVA